MENNNSSQEFDNDSENDELWSEEILVGEEELSPEVEVDTKDLDAEKSKIRKSIEEFKEQQRLKELLGEHYED